MLATTPTATETTGKTWRKQEMRRGWPCKNTSPLYQVSLLLCYKYIYVLVEKKSWNQTGRPKTWVSICVYHVKSIHTLFAYCNVRCLTLGYNICIGSKFCINICVYDLLYKAKLWIWMFIDTPLLLFFLLVILLQLRFFFLQILIWIY